MSDTLERHEPLTATVEEAGRIAGLSRQSAYAAAKLGEMPTIKLNGRLRVPLAKWRRILNGEDAA
jgi:hypothetical protein